MGKNDDDNDDEEESGGGKKKLIMGVGGLVMVGAVYNFVLKGDPPPDEMAMVEEVEVEPMEGEIIELPEMVINITDDEIRYARIAVALVLEEGTLAADFEAESAIAKDIVLDEVSSLSADELRNNRQQVKDDLSIKVREAYGDEKVVRVLITSLVMQ